MDQRNNSSCRPPLKDRRRLQDLGVVRRPDLLRAARSGSLPLLEEFLRKEDEVSAPRADALVDEAAPSALCMPASLEGASALHVVAASGNSHEYLAVAQLICSKAPELLLACDGNGETPLHCAVRAGNTEMVSLLIQQANGPDERKTMVRMQNKRGETALHAAVRCGHVKQGWRMVKELMYHDKELARVVASDGTSALYLAVSLRRASVALELMSQDQELSYSGPLGQNALHPAALFSREMTRDLLERNKDLRKQQDLSGSTPTHFAASAEEPSLDYFVYAFVEWTLEFYSLGIYFAPANCLIRVYSYLNLQLYQLLHTDPSSAFQCDNNGMFPVHVAASAGNMLAIIILVMLCPGSAGLRDSQGRTLLHTAVERKMHSVVKFVRMRPEFNSIMNMQDNQGNTALHRAVLEGHLGIVQTLMLNPHVGLNLSNHEGKTPMDLAESQAPRGFYFGMHARRRILDTLSFATASPSGSRRRDFIKQKLIPMLDKDEEESKKITEFAQIVGICSVLVATASFAAGFAMPGGTWSDNNDDNSAPTPSTAGPIGTPIMAGRYAFDGFVIANSLAFGCSTIATFSLVFWGITAVDIENRIKLVGMSLAFLNGAARSFCAAFAFALYLLLSPVVPATAIATTTMMTVLVLLDALRYVWLLLVDTFIVLNRRRGLLTVLKLTAAFIINMVSILSPYIIIFSLLEVARHNKIALHAH